jgi:hypothetical protein
LRGHLFDHQSKTADPNLLTDVDPSFSLDSMTIDEGPIQAAQVTYQDVTVQHGLDGAVLFRYRDVQELNLDFREWETTYDLSGGVEPESLP